MNRDRRKRFTQGEVIDALGEEISESIVRHAIGFIHIIDGHGNPIADLAGTGTLVSVRGTRAILTAWHVIENLPKSGRVGVVISKQPLPTSIEVDQLRPIKVGHGRQSSEGPDLGLLPLSPDVANSIAAKQTFYNLDLRRTSGSAPLEFEGGIWSMTGFINEWTVDGPEPKQRGFRCFSGLGKPTRYFEQAGYDYYDSLVDAGPVRQTPESFEGMSGGGLWYVTIKCGDDGQPKIHSRLLCGVAFYQTDVSVDSRTVRFHGQRSIYEIAYGKIGSD